MIDDVLLPSLATLVPPLPILPGRISINGRAVRSPFSCSLCRCVISLGLVAPSCPCVVVCSPSNRVGKDFMSRDDDPVSMQPSFL